MSSGTLIFLLLVVGLPLAMMFMHRGGHGHGVGGAMGGCGMGHGGQGQGHGGHRDDSEDGAADKPVLGNPGQPTERREQARHAGHARC